MTNTLLDHHTLVRIVSRESGTAKLRQIVALLLFVFCVGVTFAQSVPSQSALTYNDGDLFLGFRATDGTSDYLINIGQPAQFVNAAPGSTFQVNVGSTSADLSTAFGSDWYTRIDPGTGRNAVLWAIVGGRQIAASGDPDNTLYSTNPISNPWPRRSDTAQSFTTSLTAGMGNAFAGNLPTANNPNGLIQSAAGANSYATFQPGGANSNGISFQTWNPSDEGLPASNLFFNRIIPGSGASTVLGAFVLTSDGHVGFNAPGAPSPTPPGSPTPTATATASPTPTATGTPAPTPTPSIAPSPTPTVTPSTFGNISTRLRVETGDNALIGGFIVTGTQPKKIIVRAIGPSLASFFPGVLANPILELRNSAGTLLASNDNWRSDQQAEIIATGVPPSDDLESAIVATLPANNASYTAIVRGVNNTTGIGVVEAYDLDRTVNSKLGNISTRGLVQTGDNVMIGGLIVLGPNPLRVIVRAIGPSLPLSGVLGDPTLELHDGNGALIASNNNWRTDQEAEIIATGIPPSSDLESAIVRDLNPGNYTAIVRGVNNTTGVAVVEAYGLN
jgi:hypothetical protein